MALLSHILQRLFLFVVFLLPLAWRWRLLVRPYRRTHDRLQAALSHPEVTQLDVLRRIMEANRGTEFGRAHAFDQIRDRASFAERVPMRSYAELEPFVERQRLGESNVLVGTALVGFAVTGGSRGRPKPLLVTRESLRTWAAAEELLAREAIRNHPRVARGDCLHILPCCAEQTSRTTLPLAPMPVLAEMEGAAVGLRRVLGRQVFSVLDERQRYYLILRLSIGRRVSVLRAACPGTLIILAEYLEQLGPELVEDVAAGRLKHVDSLPQSLREALPAQRPDRPLAQRLGRRLADKGRLEPVDVWPDLSLLICSTTGSSQVAAGRLPDHFGNLAVMDPGYRAAEGILTWAWWGSEGGLPLLDGQFLEFLPAGQEAGSTLALGELEVGRRYVLVLTGFNGMYRYVMDDVLEVTSRTDGLPRFSVIGRSSFALRLQGGSLGEDAVREAVSTAATSVDVVLNGCTVWLAKEEMTAAAGVDAPPGSKWGWLSRLLGRSEDASEGPPRPMLTVAVEPAEPLAPERGKRLLAAVEQELRKRSAFYDKGRAEGALGRPCMLLLKPQTFSRSRRRRLAEGMSSAHAALPMLTEDGWLVAHEDVEQQVQG